MEAILHLEPIVREVDTPMSIGDTQFLFYGEGECDSDDEMGDPTANILLGHPLHTGDMGSSRDSIPLVKTIEYFRDHSRGGGDVFSETIHYYKDNKYLIPVRTKIKSGKMKGYRFNHLPSLNYIRNELVGVGPISCDPMTTILNDLILHDQVFKKKIDHPIIDWIQNDLIRAISDTPTADLNFSTDQIEHTILKLSSDIGRMPYYDMSSSHLKEILGHVTRDPSLLPIHYSSDDVLVRTINDFRNMAIPHSVDLRSTGRLRTSHIPRMARNPKSFHQVIEFLDNLPASDINIDLMVAEDDITLFHKNVLVDRISHFDEPEFNEVSPALTNDLHIYPDTLINILEKFVHHHPSITDEIKEILIAEPVKMKIIKTITDEALILLYRYDSTSKDEPLCGVYFDIAVASIAPTSLVRLCPNLY
jgi:hypothetical protein